MVTDRGPVIVYCPVCAGLTGWSKANFKPRRPATYSVKDPDYHRCPFCEGRGTLVLVPHG